MKKILLFAMMLIASFSFGQNLPMDFETGGQGADWAWTIAENSDNPALEFVTNPDKTAPNTSETVAKFTARADGAAWALFHSEGIGTFTFTESNCYVKIMVHKQRVSNVGIKFENADASVTKQVLVANTKTDEWEELTFDFSSVIGTEFARVVIIPDFEDRATEQIVYLDNMTFNQGQVNNFDFSTIDFETTGLGAEWGWTVDQNGDNPALEFVTNPDNSGINTSATAAKFTAKDAGQNWALCFTDEIGTVKFDETNSIVKMMVYKSVISNVGLKFEGATAREIQVPNTKTNEWEELTFDFSAEEGKSFGVIVIIPDFAARDADNVVYFDNISFSDGTTTAIEMEDLQQLRVYSNSGQLHIKADKEFINSNVEVFSLTGQRVLNDKLSKDRMNISLKSGLYIVRISDENHKPLVSKKVYID